MKSAAVLFDRLGPYHWARLEACSEIFPTVGMEVFGESSTYRWDRVEQPSNFHRVSLFAGCSNSEVAKTEICRAVRSTLVQLQPTAIAVPGWSDTAALAALGWCSETATPAVMMSESTSWDEKRTAWREAVKRRIVGLCSAALVGGSPHAEYVVALGMPRERVFLGYDAVDNGYFAAGANRARSAECETRNKYGLPERYFLASARFIEKKNLPRLIEAYARYRVLAQDQTTSKPQTTDHKSSRQVVPWSSGPVVPWSLVLLGDGPLRNSLTTLRSALGLDACVQMPGFKQYPDLPAYYGLAGAFVHASTTEQWGLVVNEAMAAGLLVLVSNRCGCATDLVQEGVNGFTFDPQDTEALAQLMLQVSAFQPLRLSAFGDASRQIISNWGPERFASGLKQAAECALKVGPKRAGLFDRLLLNALIRR